MSDMPKGRMKSRISEPGIRPRRSSRLKQKQEKLIGKETRNLHQLSSPSSTESHKYVRDQKRKRLATEPPDIHLSSKKVCVGTKQNPREREPERSNHKPQNDEIEHPTAATTFPDNHSETKDKTCDPITHWARYSTWPQNFAEKIPKMTDIGPQNRARSIGYTASVKIGENPRAYSMEYEKKMNEHGMITDFFQDLAAITEDCKQLCSSLLEGDYEKPSDLHDKYFIAALRAAHMRNESRVTRDITPIIVPSAERLHIRNVANLKDIIEEVNADWNKCGVIFGPQPKPNFAVGLKASAFTSDELSQLKSYHTDQCPSYVTDDMYFPFLVCKVGSANNPLAEAERQTMHSASIVVKSIIELYRKISREKELDRKILVFSIAHDIRCVKLYGHYALVTGKKLQFFRHCIGSIFFADNTTDRWKVYNFTRSIYDKFAPIHLQRIRDGLSMLHEHPSESEYEVVVDNSVEAPSQALLPSMVSSQGGSREFKKPALSATAMVLEANKKLENEKNELLRQVSSLIRQQQEQQEQERQRQEQQRQREEQQPQREERMERQLERLEQQRKEELERLEQQRKEEQEGLKQQLERLEQQRKEALERLEQRRKEEQEGLKHQISQLMSLLESKK